MFIVTDTDQSQWSIPLVDFHTHVGKVKIETTKGASQRINRPQDILDLYQKLKFELYDRISTKKESYYIALPSIDKFDFPMFPMVKNHFLKDYTRPQGWIIDHIVTFPFNDIFHLKTNPKFVKSNDYVRQQVQKPEFTFRFIPFCRVDATEIDAPQEIINSYDLGIKGLKLHPLSQNWVDKIVSDEVKKVLKTAGNLKLPIIFDVPNKGVAEDITQISIEARKETSDPINVILGHNGFDYSSPEIFKYLSQKDMYTEVSGMRGADVPLFFKNVVEVQNWEKKILFGSDANYFSVLQAVDFISYLFTYDFLDLIRNKSVTGLRPLEIVSNILGLNALRIIPRTESKFLNVDYSKTILIPTNDISLKIKDFTKNKKNKILINLLNDNNYNKLCYLLTLSMDNKIQSFLFFDDKNLSNFILEPYLNEKFEFLDYIKIKNLHKSAELQLKFESENELHKISKLEEIFQDN